MPPRPEISVVVPCLNEVENLRLTHQRLVGVIEKIADSFEIIFVDDGSKDGSRELMRELNKEDPRVKVLLFSRNFGHQMALTAGLDAAEGNAVVLIDADLQDPPEVIADLVKKWREGFEVVYAVRRTREGETFFKKASASLFYRFLSMLSRVDIPRNTGDFRLLDRQVVLAYRRLQEQSRFLRGLTAWLGFRQVGVEYDRKPRNAGQTHYSLQKMVRLGVDGILSFSRLPLRLSMYFGMLIGLGGLAFTFYLVIRRLFGAFPVPGWTSTMAAVVLMGSLNLVFLGIIGEYLSRVYNEVRNRPLFVIQDKVGFD